SPNLWKRLFPQAQESVAGINRDHVTAVQRRLERPRPVERRGRLDLVGGIRPFDATLRGGHRRDGETNLELRTGAGEARPTRNRHADAEIRVAAAPPDRRPIESSDGSSDFHTVP